jgi:hypothetical protein
LQFDVPIPRPPCPTIDVGEFSIKSGYSDSPCVAGESTFVFRTNHREPENCRDPGECKFEVDLNLLVPIPRPPCPQINVTEFSVSSHLTPIDGQDCEITANKFVILTDHVTGNGCNDPGQCIFNVELAIDIPIPRPECPEINVKKFEVKTHLTDRDDQVCDTTETKFEITRRVERGTTCHDPDKCFFDVELQLDIPIPRVPCPEVNISVFEVNTYLTPADGRTIFNLSASQRWAVDQAAVTLYARLNNASDERYVGSVIVNQSSKQFDEPCLPRNWMLGIAVSAPL